MTRQPRPGKSLSVDFELTDEQHMFREVRTHVKPVARDWEDSGRYPGEIVEQMKELERLPRLAAGEMRSCIALTEPGAGSDLQGIASRATRDGDTYIVRGTKMWITNARHAGVLPVLVQTDPSAEPRHRGQSVLLVEQGTPGLTITKDLGKLGYKGTESCEVVFDDCVVPADTLLGGVEGRGLPQVLSALELGRINVATRAVGVAQAALDMAIEYSKERRRYR